MAKELFLTVSQAAKSKGVSRTTVYKAIGTGLLPSYEVLGRTAVRETDLRAADLGKRKRGRASGQALSEGHKAAITKGQKQRWARKKKER